MSEEQIDVKALADLARLEVTPEELLRLEKELPSILQFVKTIQDVAGETRSGLPAMRNVMRDDNNPHESGKYTEALLTAAPGRKGNHVVVKQVLTKRQAE